MMRLKVRWEEMCTKLRRNMGKLWRSSGPESSRQGSAAPIWSFAAGQLRQGNERRLPIPAPTVPAVKITGVELSIKKPAL
jgi:hypothetical protein